MVPFLIAALVISAAAAVFDWKTGQIPNWITLPALFLAPVVHFVVASARGVESSDALLEGGFSVTGAMVTGIVPMILFRQNAIGGGDLKLLAALGAVCMPVLGLELEMYGFLAAIVIAPAQLAYKGKLLGTLKNTFFIAMNSMLPKEKRKTVEPEAMSWFRLGPCIFLGVLLTTAFHWRAP